MNAVCRATCFCLWEAGAPREACAADMSIAGEYILSGNAVQLPFVEEEVPLIRLRIEAAAICSRGRVRSNNEDNLFFAGEILEQEHDDLPRPIGRSFSADGPVLFGVFDGMGGEEKGEVASFFAAKTMKEAFDAPWDRERDPWVFLEDLCAEMNRTVCREAEALPFGHMGSTVAALLFDGGIAFSCNLGDSKVFRYRDGACLQMSTDHLEILGPKALEERRKPRLVQYLGVAPEDLTLEPSIVKCEVKKGDIYLICSDGLTDLVPEEAMADLLGAGKSPRRTAAWLQETALSLGGKDNITAVLCLIQ